MLIFTMYKVLLCEFEIFINNTWTLAHYSHSALDIYILQMSRESRAFSKAFELFLDWK